MKAILLSLSLVSVLSLSSCFSLATSARAGLGADISVGERLSSAAIDVVTLPIQIPAVAISRASEVVTN